MTQETSTRGLAVITGASAGLGEQFARQLSARDYEVLLVARREDRLSSLVGELQAAGRKASAVTADLASPEGRAAMWSAIDARGEVPALVVNNAGFGVNAFAWEIPAERAVEMIRLNVEALTVIAMESAKRMVPGGQGAIINVSSTAAFQATPYMAVYGATKGYDLLFSEALHEELKATGVRVFTMCPGYTETEFQQVASLRTPPPRRFVTDAESCVRRALDAFVLGEKLYIDGTANAALQFMQRFVPRSWVVALSAKALKSKPKG